MKTILITSLVSLFAASILGAEVKFVTEYRYPTSYQVIPITQTGPNGNIVMGGIVIPQDFETREVGVVMSVIVEVGRLGGISSVSDGVRLINGNTELMMAATMGDIVKTEKAIAKTDINAKNKFGSTALMGASAGGNEKIVKLLLSKGADVNIKSNEGNSALQFAKRNGHEDIVRLLTEYGAKS